MIIISTISYLINIEEFTKKIIEPLKAKYSLTFAKPEAFVRTMGILAGYDGMVEIHNEQLGQLKAIAINSVDQFEEPFNVTVSLYKQDYTFWVENGGFYFENEGATFLSAYEKIKIQAEKPCLVNFIILEEGD